jgi:hypothetical protein
LMFFMAKRECTRPTRAIIIGMPESTQLTASAAILAPTGRRAQILAGITDSFSAGLGIFPFGIALGLLVMQLGLPWWIAPALSLSAFAGSLELLLVGMIASVEPLAAVAVTVFVVNFRHVFYAFSFPRHLVRNRFARLYATYAMIDEVYAVNAALPKLHQSAARILAMQLACEIYWVGGGLVGVLIASSCPVRSKVSSSHSAPCSVCSRWMRSGLAGRFRRSYWLAPASGSPWSSRPESPCSSPC